jgi:hypothetical protein
MDQVVGQSLATFRRIDEALGLGRLGDGQRLAVAV